MYVCRCHTCEESRSAVRREHVQQFFNDHADDGHEVVLKRVASTTDPSRESRDGGQPVEANTSTESTNGDR